MNILDIGNSGFIEKHFSEDLTIDEAAKRTRSYTVAPPDRPENLLRGVNPERWVELHGDCLFRYALWRVRRPEVAEDLVQETLCAAIRIHSTFLGKSSERSWLCGILKKKICDYFRKRGREVSFTDLGFLQEEMAHKFVEQPGFWNHDPGPLKWKPEAEAVIHRAEFWETFRACLSKLPVRVADVFILREIEEMDSVQICKALRISQNNLWVMSYRARMALRECLLINWFKEQKKEESDQRRV
jgi:RNA polymerase sigma-70 factor (ECF subfamily)